MTRVDTMTRIYIQQNDGKDAGNTNHEENEGAHHFYTVQNAKDTESLLADGTPMANRRKSRSWMSRKLF